MSSSFPNKEFDHVAIGVADKYLLYTIATGTRATHNLHTQRIKVLYCRFQILYFEGGMRPLTTCKLIAAILRMRLCHTTVLGLANEVNFKAVLIIGEPRTGITRVAWTRNFSQPQYLTVEAAQTLNVFHKK